MLVRRHTEQENALYKQCVWKKFSGLNKLRKNSYFLRHVMTKSKGLAVVVQLLVLLLTAVQLECFRVGCCLLVLLSCWFVCLFSFPVQFFHVL